MGSSPINDFIFSMSQCFAQSLDELGEFFCKNDVFDLESGNGRVASVYGFSIFLPTLVVFSRVVVCDRHNNDDECGN